MARRDGTANLLAEIAAQDRRVTVVELSRNFGHQAALTAGLDLAQGDYVISLDGDGQHPPERIAEMIQLARQGGYDIVLMQRVDESSGGSFKRGTSSWFYRIINAIGDTHIVPGAADFRLMSHSVVLALRSMREYSRFLRGMVNWMGFRTVILPYTQPARLAGKSKYTLRKMLPPGGQCHFFFFPGSAVCGHLDWSCVPDPGGDRGRLCAQFLDHWQPIPTWPPVGVR